MVRRGQHFIDLSLGGRNRKRMFRNWMNYREPGSNWLVSNPRPDAATGIPDNWSGNFTHQIYSQRGPAQVALGNNPSGCPHIRVRNAHRTEEWAEFIWLGPANGSFPKISHNKKRIRWVDWKTNTNLVYILGPRGIHKTIRLKSPGHPSRFRFAVKLPPGHTCNLIGGQLLIRDQQGMIYMTTGIPYGFDSSTVAPTLDGTRPINVMIKHDGMTIQGWKIFELTPDPNDLTNAVYPVLLDPSITISGTTDLEDTFSHISLKDNNFGGRTSTLIFNLISRVTGQVRIVRSAIPAGSYSAFSLFAFKAAAGNSDLYWTRYLDAAAWVEGSNPNGIEVGATCWNWLQYNTVPWPGSVGGLTVGVDIQDDPLTLTPQSMIGLTVNEVMLDPQWIDDWASDTTVANGISLHGNLSVHSTENVGSDPLFFEATYSEPTTGSSFFFQGF